MQKDKVHLLTITALFAAAITVMTAYMLHIPIPTGGYIHLGDALIYLAACLLPLPYAAGAAAIGAGLADLLTAPMWVLPTLVIKAIIALFFTRNSDKLLCRRNLAAVVIAGRAVFPRRLRSGRLRHGRDYGRFCPPVLGHSGSGHRQRRAVSCDCPRPGRGETERTHGHIIQEVLL